MKNNPDDVIGLQTGDRKTAMLTGDLEFGRHKEADAAVLLELEGGPFI